ncbi:MAG: hypothetical protein KDA96_24100, partial [Planctomycetaceae bacterium]|nr:hypothetical protein [Planctomycetaceae bacterium]
MTNRTPGNSVEFETPQNTESWRPQILTSQQLDFTRQLSTLADFGVYHVLQVFLSSLQMPRCPFPRAAATCVWSGER